MFKLSLMLVERQFESVKRWFDKNNYPHPFSKEDKLKKIDWNGSIYALSDEMREKKDHGAFATYREAYRWCEKNYTVNGETITLEQLENNYYVAIAAGKL